MDQTRALAALAPFHALAKSATSPRAAADLITQATSAQGTYVFAELLATPNIAALKTDSQYGSHHTLLEIFAWGTWETYRSTPNLPPLSDAQTLKLRLLSLLTFAADKHGNLSYASLCKRLELADAVDLEHLVTTAIYYNLLTATLNPASQTVVISSVAPLRDLAPGSVKDMLADLAAWSARCDSVLGDLEGEIARVKAEAAKRAAREAKTERQVKAAVDTAEKGSGGAGGALSALGSGSRNTRSAGRRDVPSERYEMDEDINPQNLTDSDDDPMDVDGQSGGGKKKMSPFFGKGKAK